MGKATKKSHMPGLTEHMKKHLTLIALPLLLAACGTGNPLEVRRTSCPAIAVPKYTGTLTRFSQAGRFDVQDVLLVASIGQLDANCEETEAGVRTALSFNILATRPVKGPAEAVQLPFFVTVVKDGETLIAKQVYGASVNFADGAASANLSQVVTVATPKIPLPPRPKKNNEFDEFAPPPKPAVYELLVGFQLSDSDVVYNITK
jgi:hypothetical protein